MNSEIPGPVPLTRCTVCSDGEILKKDPLLYAVLWIGSNMAIGLVIAALLVFMLAVPAGVLIVRLLSRRPKTSLAAKIEPE